MGKVERGSFTILGAGNTTVLFTDPTLIADKITFSMGPAGTSDSVCHSSDGLMIPAQQCCKSIYMDTTGGKSQHSNSKCLSHLARVSGTITEVTTATRQNMATAGEFTINVTAFNSGYTTYFVAEKY